MKPASQTQRVLLTAAFACVCLRAQIAIGGRVVDETGSAVAGALIEVRQSATLAAAVTSDPAGDFNLSLPAAGEFDIRAERQGFYVYQGSAHRFDESQNQLNIVLNHLREFYERVDVSASPPVVDPQQMSDRREIEGRQAQAVPFPAPQDFRNALPMADGVLQDSSGAIHVNGGETGQTSYTLDGFNVANPVTGALDARVNIESIQALDLSLGRFSADTGRGSAGALDLKTKMGDDRWRFGGTNFIPGVSTDGGLHVNKWTPRLELSGPLVRGRAWFHTGIDGFYNLDVVRGLPPGQNRTRGFVGSDLTRFQVNLKPSNILTASFLADLAVQLRTGLSILNPVEATNTHRQRLFMSSVRDQQYLGGAVLELGFADTRSELRDSPQGDQIYLITPFGNRGNYFERTDRHAYRQQELADLFLPVFRFQGEHQLKFGIDVEREAFHQTIARHNYELTQTDGSVERLVSFVGAPFQARKNLELAGYVQDHWTPMEGLVFEAGLRTDWNEVVRQWGLAPRVAATWAPRGPGGTKFSAGWGVYYDSIPLSVLASQQDQTSLSTFYPPGGMPVGPLATSFRVADRSLTTPRYQTVSLGLERKLPFDFYWKTDYTHRNGDRGLVFVPEAPPPQEGATLAAGATAYYDLRNARHDRYDAVDFSLHRTFARQYEWFAGYTRSAARTNAVIDFSLQNPVFAAQAPGRFPWDAPNRFHMWGWLPLPNRRLPAVLRFITRDTDAAYLIECRTGFPFSVADEAGYQVGAPGSMRFPGYFNVNLHLERKFHALHYLWAWRFGFNNITGHNNPNVVNNILGTPQYLTYGGGQVRAFSVRLRMLGRK